jgi:hypothetical protein
MRLPSLRATSRTGRRRAALVLVVVAVAAAVAACTLNPQPLPPGDDSERGQATGDFDASTRADAGGFSGEEPAPNANADAAAGDHEAGVNDGSAGDGGDAGDAGDAAPDAG